MNIRTSRRYARFSDLELSKQAGRVVAGLTNNPNLPDPPVVIVAFTAAKQAFDQAIVAAAGGGQLATAQKDMARAALIDILNKDASYVDINCNGDRTILLSSGFEAVNTNRSQSVLETPEVLATEYAQQGEIRLRIRGDSRRRAVLGRVKPIGGEYGTVVTFRTSREILFRGLSAGTTYVMQVCGLGGSTGRSDWSEAVEKVAV